MPTTLPVAYTTLVDGFSKGSGPGGPTYRVTYKIDNWADSDRMVNALVGSASVTGPPGAGGTVTRNAPHQYPLSPNLSCVSAEVIQGLGNPVLNSNGYPDFDGGALIAAEYRALSWDAITPDINNSIDPLSPLTYCSQKLSFTTETIQIPENTFKYRAGILNGFNTNVPAKIQIPITELILKFFQVPYMPVTVMRSLRGRVNTSTFLGAQPGTVIFRGGETDRTFGTDGSAVQDVEMKFSERDPLHMWNSLPCRSSLTWFPVSDDNLTKMFPEGDLNLLLHAW